ncbi:MAG: tetratricopeptide repeat protein [Gammaproteobacteria bacterium]|nr:tetratricopeptide repeat protein [Gammaproteobacteria bacterium]
MSGTPTRLAAIIAHVDRGDFAGALNGCATALAENPLDGDLICLAGMINGRLGRLPDAEACFREALAAQPDHPYALYNLGKVAAILSRSGEAVAAYRRALEIRPDFAEAYTNLGNLYGRSRRWKDAAECLRRGLACPSDPDNRLIHLVPQREDAALQIMSAYLALQSYHVLTTPEESLALHRDWEARYKTVHGVAPYHHSRSRALPKRLRIGYVSPDFRQHSVAYFMEPILAAHDRERVEVYCYAEVRAPDAVTERLRGLSDHWRETVNLSDAEVARRIHEDGIDVLVDLAGHTRDGRLGVFVHRPAPVQATYLGYFTTTGLSAMDYWLSDAVLSPDDTAEPSSERIWRLPGCSFCYAPAADAPEVADRSPSEPFTLGCFNDLSKVSDEALALWARVMQAVPDARLVLKAKQFADQGVREDFIASFASSGITANRLQLLTRTPDARTHLALYGGVDVALDTIPRTGGTTTAEALWMGVPVVTLAGKRYVERLSASMLHCMGLTDCITADENAYVDRVAAFARDRTALRELRTGMRARLKAAGFCDGRRVARMLEAGFNDMYQAFLRGE